jgi:DNA polymerase-3 subunit gamma/tau
VPPPEPLAPVTDALGLDTAISSWPAVLDLVKGQNSMLATALAAARPVAVGERELTLAFPDGASFLKRKAEQDEHRRVAAEALKTVTGHRLALRYELREDEEESEQAGEPALSGEELVRRFLEEFDAEELIGDETDMESAK